MAPYTSVTTTMSIENNNNNNKTTNFNKDGYKSIIGTFGAELKWLNIISIATIHVVLVCGLVIFPYFQHLRLLAWCVFVGGTNGLGVTAGAHRLWCHRSYKAKLPLRIILMLCFSMAAQNTLFDWVRDHRVHHKFTETDADPHNSKRGFFFAHVGWLMMKKHPDVLSKGKDVDMSDILDDPVVQFHHRHFILLKIIFGFVLPAIVPPLWWGQDWYWSVLSVCVGRYCFSLNFTWLVNSAAHMWGNRPYDKKIGPVENLTVAILAMGEGWHNYHHTFPWDYKTAELGKYSVNLTTFWIDLFSKIGWAYDLKTPSAELVRKVIQKSGDGTHSAWEGLEVPESAERDFVSDKNVTDKST